jgi:hypothetical protein
VTTWTPEELSALSTSGSLSLSAADGGHLAVEVGMVLVGGELYVRAYRGAQSGWYQASRVHGRGRIRVGDVARDVLLQALDENGPHDAIDAAYQARYPSVGGLVTSSVARSATIRIIPAQPSRRH